MRAGLLQPHDPHFAALGRQADLAPAEAHRILAKGLGPPAMQGIAIPAARRDGVQIGGDYEAMYTLITPRSPGPSRITPSPPGAPRPRAA